MRIATLSAAAAFVVLAPHAFAQTETPKGYTGANQPAGTPPTQPTPVSPEPLPQVDTGPGLDVAAPDGSTKTVKAVPCAPYARETDGTTTCIGIPGPVRRGDSRERTTVGRSRR
jgi:hypothetical protein